MLYAHNETYLKNNTYQYGMMRHSAPCSTSLLPTLIPSYFQIEDLCTLRACISPFFTFASLCLFKREKKIDWMQKPLQFFLHQPDKFIIHSGIIIIMCTCVLKLLKWYIFFYKYVTLCAICWRYKMCVRTYIYCPHYFVCSI